MRKLALIAVLFLPMTAWAVVRIGAVVRPAIAGVVPAAPPDDTIFMEDSFTDTDAVLLSAHTGESASWVRHSSYTTATASIATNRIKADSGVTYCYYVTTNTVSTTADYYVTALVFTKSVTTQGAGPCIRVSTSANTMYFTRYRQSSGTWELWKLVAGTSTQLGSYTVGQLANQTWTIRLGAIGTTITVDVDGVNQISVTDSSITAAGRAGVRGIDQSSSGHHITYVKGQNPP